MTGLVIVGREGIRYYKEAHVLVDHAEDLKSELKALVTHVEKGNYEAANLSVQKIDNLSAEMRQIITDERWVSLREKTPKYGDDLDTAVKFLDVVDEAFEYLINKSSKGEKGQYFTPRYVIDMCVKMLNPTDKETMIDTAAGSCGFPVHTIFYVWQKILESKGLKKSHLFTSEQKPPECTDYVQNKVFATQ